jgi:hypothetical protein
MNYLGICTFWAKYNGICLYSTDLTVMNLCCGLCPMLSMLPIQGQIVHLKYLWTLLSKLYQLNHVFVLWKQLQIYANQWLCLPYSCNAVSIKTGGRQNLSHGTVYSNPRLYDWVINVIIWNHSGSHYILHYFQHDHSRNGEMLHLVIHCVDICD